MKTRSRAASWCNVLGTVLAFAGASLALSPAYASDTEVYSRITEIDSADAKPVLMMMLDSSDLMNACITAASGNSCADADNTRRAIMTRAMGKALFGNHDSASGSIIKPAPGFIRMGYSRFMPDGNQGAWVRYPALRLDKELEVGASLAFSGVKLDLRVPNAASDATATTTAPTTSVTTTSDTVFTLGNNNPEVVVRFADVTIPKGATIDSATLTFTTHPSNTGNSAPDLFVASETSDDAQDFSTLTTRTYTNESASQSGIVLNVRDQIQAVADRGVGTATGWCGGNALSLKVRSGPSNKSKKVYAFDGSGTDTLVRPRLQVTYTLTDSTKLANSCLKLPIDVVQLVSKVDDDIEWPASGSDPVSSRNSALRVGAIPDGVNNLVAARFQNMRIRPASTIEEAWLYSTAAAANADDLTPTIRVQAFNQDNVPPFCSAATPTSPVVCSKPDVTAASLTAASSFVMTAGANGTHFVANVKNQVQTVVNRPGWVLGKAMGFLMQNDTTTASLRGIAAVDNGASRAMILHVRARQGFTDLTGGITKTVRQELLEDITTKMVASGGTPLGDGYQETARYLLGRSEAVEASTATLGTTTYDVPDPRALANATTYASPIDSTDQCSPNYIFAMSSGEAANASNVNNKSNEVTAVSPPSGLTCNAVSIAGLTSNEKANFECMRAVAQYLAVKDSRPPTVAPEPALSPPYKPFIRTNTVQFNGAPSSTISTGMKAVADAGQGKYYLATDETAMLNALLDTLHSVVDEVGSITAPGVAVNQFNRLTHLDELYYAVFDPDTGRARWRGNVKRYRLVFPDANTVEIQGMDGKNAVDPGTTFFANRAVSFWNPSPATDPDGNIVTKGGVSQVLPDPASRKIYTDPTVDSNTLQKIDATDFPVASVRAAMGLTTDDQFRNVRNWLLGYNVNIVDTTAPAPDTIKTALVSTTGVSLRKELGGVLHSQPVLVNYGFTGASAAAASVDPEQQDNVVFFSTMEGMLHAVDTSNGVEMYSFIPKATLEFVDDLITNNPQDLPAFGLDLTWTPWRVDANKDFQITSGSSGDRLYLFGGMRMGGSNYYAMDVTNRNTPMLKWVITPSSTGFSNLGQTWSKPVLGNVRVNNVVKTVLFFAGGYDNKHETAGYTTANDSDAKGKQIYIVDPETGALLWSSVSVTGSTSMNFSIPSELKLFDANKDGLTDAVYFGDMGGQVFRLDINNNAATDADLGTRLHLLASVGQSVVANTTNQRRFYEAPSVSTLLDADKKPYVVVALGSGYRSHPLDESTEDAFYVFQDTDVMSQTNLQATITPTDLAVVNLATADGVNLTGKKGWMMDLPESGEKVLASPIILFGEVFFTSYVPKRSAGTACSPVIGETKLWRMSVTDAAVLKDFNNDGVVNKDDRSIDNVVKGLGGAPQLLVGEDGRNAIITGTGVIRNNDLANPSMRRTRWYEKEAK